MKKKICFIMFALMILTLSACGKSKLNLADYVIEQREHLYTACDDLYCVSFSTGFREKDYNFDGIKNEMVPFGVLTFSRCERLPLANDTYSYLVTINEETYSGFLQKGGDNSYSADLEVNTNGTENINVQISFTGYTFNKNLESTSSLFEIDSSTALNIATKELKENVDNLLKDKNIKIEVVMKLMKDHSCDDLKSYYWYVGIISTNGETMGILIDANNGVIIAKKV